MEKDQFTSSHHRAAKTFADFALPEGWGTFLRPGLSKRVGTGSVPAWAEELRPIFDAAAAARAVGVVGLMLLPPAADDPEASRPYFRALRDLRDRLVADGVDPGKVRELSKGMSHDFEVAVEVGATLVRVGSAMFGARGV